MKKSVKKGRTKKRSYSLLGQAWLFLKERKKWWLLPIVIMLAIVGLLIVFAQSSPLSSLLYALF